MGMIVTTLTYFNACHVINKYQQLPKKTSNTTKEFKTAKEKSHVTEKT